MEALSESVWSSLYDLSMNQNSRLANISTRGFVRTGNDIMIGGFIVGGNNGQDNIIMQGIGPSFAHLES